MLASALFCWLTWSGSATALTVGLLLLLARPGPRFEAGLSLAVAGSERGLRSATARSLTSLQRGRAARVCLDAAGDVVASPARAVVVLVADRGGVRFAKSGGVEVSERVGRPWRPVDAADPLRSGVRYRVDGLYFRLD